MSKSDSSFFHHFFLDTLILFCKHIKAFAIKQNLQRIMKSTTIVLLAVLTGPVLMTNAWCLLPRYYGGGGCMTPFPVVREPQKQSIANPPNYNKANYNAPRYEITKSRSKWQIALDVPGMNIEDIRVRIDEDERLLYISGHRESVGETYKFSSNFSRKFSLDASVVMEDFKATLNQGILIVSAPIESALWTDTKVRSIPITQNGDDKKDAYEKTGKNGKDEKERNKDTDKNKKHIQ
jgi:HSP20 family molecular chaperone IbpA